MLLVLLMLFGFAWNKGYVGEWGKKLTTQISAGTFVGTLGRYYETGVSWGWGWFGVWAGWVVSAVFVAPKWLIA